MLTQANTRQFERVDADAVVRLSLRAWEPVFASFRAVAPTFCQDRCVRERPAVKAMALVRRSDGSILVSEGADKGGRFQRPLGGDVEYGELAAAAIEREFMEELGLGLRALGLLGVLENLFADGERQFHEVVFLLEAEFTDPAPYSWETFPRHDHAAATTTVLWRPHGATKPPLFPTGVGAYL